MATAPVSLQAEEMKTLPLSEEELIAIANASAICFGLKPRTMRDKYTDLNKLGA